MSPAVIPRNTIRITICTIVISITVNTNQNSGARSSTAQLKGKKPAEVNNVHLGKVKYSLIILKKFNISWNWLNFSQLFAISTPMLTLEQKWQRT